MTTQAVGSELPVTITRNVGTIVLVVAVIILVINLSTKLGQRVGPYLGNETTDPGNVVAGGAGDVGSDSFSQNLGATLFHPKVLAMILILLVCLFAVMFIGNVPMIY